MKGPWPVVPEQPLSSDMAQPTSGLYSTFGFFICLLFLPVSWEAGANTIQELQKTVEPSIFDHLSPLTPGLTNRAPSDYKNSGQQPPDLPESTATQKPKKQCNNTRLVKPVHKPVDNAKAADYGNTTVRHETLPASGKNLSSQGKHPMARNERSADDPGSTNSTDGRHSTSAPRRSTTCRSATSRTRVTRKSSTRVSPTETSTRLRTTSQKPTTSHDSEFIKKSSSPVKSTEAPRTSYKTPKTPTTSGAEHHTTLFASDKSVQITTEHIKEVTSARKKTTRFQSTSTEREGKTGPARESTSQAQVLPVEHHTTSASENMTQVSTKSTKHPEGATSTTEKATESPTVFQRKPTVDTTTVKATGTPEKTSVILETTRPVKATEDTSTAPSPHFRKTETAHQGTVGSLTSRMDLGPTTSEAHHSQQNTHSLPGGLHVAGERGENNSFPAWAIVVVILLAVIILLIILGLIVLVSCASRARHVLTQNSEDTEPEDKGGRNSYPVYLMEQQNLKPNQIPSPP